MRRQRKKSGQTAPTTSRAEAELQECIKLKEATKNRLKLTHPPESRAAKTTREIFKILDLQPLPRKPKIKPFSDRITNPFYDFSDKPRSSPPEKPRMPLQAALDFVKRQTEWLSHKNLHEAEDSSPLDALNLEEVDSKRSWKRAFLANQKYRVKEESHSIAREKLQRKVEEAKVLKTIRKLESLVRLEPALQIALDEANKKLHFIRYGEQRHSSQPQTLIDAGDEEFSEQPAKIRLASRPSVPVQNPQTKPIQAQEIQIPSESSRRWNNERKPPLAEASAHPPTDPPQLTAVPAPVRTHPAALAPSAPLSASSLGEDEIPVPDLDPDGRVVSLIAPGLDEWDCLSDSSGEGKRFSGRKDKPFVDVHEFLRSVSIREQKRNSAGGPEQSSDDEDEEDDDDESASVY